MAFRVCYKADWGPNWIGDCSLVRRFCTAFVERRLLVGPNCGWRVTYPKRVTRAYSNIVNTLNQRRTFLVAFGGVLVASRMYVSTSALLSCYEREFLTKKIAYFMISESWTFGLQNLFVRTREPFFSNLRTFGLKNLRTHEPSNLRTFGLIGCNQLD